MVDNSTIKLIFALSLVMTGTLLAIVYSLRILVLLERRVARMESHIEKLTKKVLNEEKSIRNTIRKRY